MQEKNSKPNKKLVSRREFLVGGGAVIAAGALTACSSSTVTSTLTNTVTKSVTPAAVTTTATITPTTVRYQVMNPRAYPKPVDKVPIVPRVDAAKIKTLSIWIIGQKGKGQGALTGIAAYMNQNGYKVTEDGKVAFFGSDEPALWDRAAKDAKAIIFGVGDWGSCTSWGTQWSINFEKRGIPTVYVILQRFINDETTSAELKGMPALRRVVLPNAEDLPAGQSWDYADAVAQCVKQLTTPLTSDETATGTILPDQPPRFVDGTFSVDEFYSYCMDNRWTDGFPVTLPTADKVAAFMAQTSHKADEVVTTTMWPEEWKVTVEKVAVVGVMSGCKPIYMPCLLAMCESFGRDVFSSAVRSTMSMAFPVMVNGPFRNDAAMNCLGNALGPCNHANSTIGRFLRMAIINLGGSWPNINEMSELGNPAKYNFCFAENEEQSVWEPFSVHMGFKAGVSTVTIWNGCWSHWGMMSGLDTIAKAIVSFQWRNGCLIIFSPASIGGFKDGTAREATNKQPMSRDDVEDYIWSHATTTFAEMKTNFGYSFISGMWAGTAMFGETDLYPNFIAQGKKDTDLVTAYPRKYIDVVVAGPGGIGNAVAWKAAYPTTISIDKWK